MYPFIHENYREEYVEKLEEFVKSKDLRFVKFFKYFKKNWISNKNFYFHKISGENYERRTNNICESFHSTINRQLHVNHPKVSYLVDKLKYFSREAYQKYNMAMIGKFGDIDTSYNLSKDIYDFIKNFHKKYSTGFNITMLEDNINEEKSNLIDICKKFLDLVFTDGDSYFSKFESGIVNSNGENIEGEENDYESDSNFNYESDNLLNKLKAMTLNE